MAKRLQSYWIIKSTTAFLFLVIVSLLFGCGRHSEPFSYLVHVINEDSREPIPNAEVDLEVTDGSVIISEATDEKGYARLLIDTAYQKKPARLQVTARDYEDYVLNIDLKNDTLPPKVELRKKSVSQLPIDTPTPVPRSTDTPVLTSTPTSTSTPSPPPRVFVEASRDLSLKSIPCFRQRAEEAVDKGTLYTIVNRHIDDQSREWLQIETEAGQRGWTLLNEDFPVETPVAGRNDQLVQDVPTIAPNEVPATPEAFPPPILISPKDKANLHDPVRLEWKWDESFEKGWFFSIRVGQDAKTGHPNEPIPCFHDKISFSTVYEGDLSEFCQPGQYYWEVVVAARNEKFVEEHETTRFDPEEVKEFVEISSVSTREYFNYLGPAPSDTPTLRPTDTPIPTPTDTPEPTPTNTPGSSDDDDDGGVNPTPRSGP